MAATASNSRILEAALAPRWPTGRISQDLEE